MQTHDFSRRRFIKKTAAAGTFLALQGPGAIIGMQRNSPGIQVINPKDQVPVSFIIDDSTTLVNMAYYGIPQFHEVFPDNYPQDWKKLPREIPDSFVREFGEYCKDHGVKGKYSIVPYPACTGWVDRFIPGWSKNELQDSIALVRDFLQPDWDIHPEMISHTRVIDISTGRPYPYATGDYMENWGWSQDKSADELASYMAYALRILKNTGFECEGITTPGGFGSQNRENLAKGTLESVREVYGAEVPHYFRDLLTDKEQSVAPQVKYPADLDTDDPKCVVSIIGCTGDWFGGWDGLTPGSVERFITKDLSGGRMVDVIESGEPAIMVCHWPGIYYNGEKLGFNIFKEVVSRLEEKYTHLNWMKLSEISRYWAAKELTQFQASENGVEMYAPFSTSNYTLRLNGGLKSPPKIVTRNHQSELNEVKSKSQLAAGTWYRDGRETIVCFDLPKGDSTLMTLEDG